MHPVSMHVEWRRSPLSVCVISLKRTLKDTNEELKMVLDYVITGTVAVFHYTNIYGRKVKTFLDRVHLEVDYLPSAAVVDFMAHVINAP